MLSVKFSIYAVALAFFATRGSSIIVFNPHKLGGNATDIPLAANVPPLDPSTFTRVTYSGVQQNASVITRSEIRTRQAPAPPSSFDWRDYGGIEWFCTIQNQGNCDSCWAYVSAALIESQIRIEHGYWSKRSEGDIRDGGLLRNGLTEAQWCQQSGSPVGALDDIAINGVTDEKCFPTVNQPGPDPYDPCVERDPGRTSRIPTPTDIGDAADQKNWIANIGPIIATIEFDANNIYNAFSALKSGIFTAPADDGSGFVGQHFLLLVGYSDDGQYWIGRNSWDDTWGVNGYGLVKYGEIKIDHFSKQGLSLTSPDLWVKRRQHNGNLIHKEDDIVSSSALHKEFGLLNCGHDEVHYQIRADGSVNGQFNFKSINPQYELAQKFSSNNFGQCAGQPVLIEKADVNFQSLEALYWNDFLNQLEHLHFTNEGWSVLDPFGDGAIGGYPGLIQSNYGHPGNLEAVVRHVDGSLNHWSFENNTAGWFLNAQVATPSTVLMSGPSLIQSNAGINGNFYVVATLFEGGTLAMFWRDNDDPTNLVWAGHEVIATGFFGSNTSPVMIQTLVGATDENMVGDFDLLIANSNGDVNHYRRNNEDLRTGAQPVDGIGTAWRLIDTFGGNSGDVVNVWSFMQGPFTQNLEAVLETSFGTLQFWFSSATLAGWTFGGDAPTVD